MVAKQREVTRCGNCNIETRRSLLRCSILIVSIKVSYPESESSDSELPKTPSLPVSSTSSEPNNEVIASKISLSPFARGRRVSSTLFVGLFGPPSRRRFQQAQVFGGQAAIS